MPIPASDSTYTPPLGSSRKFNFPKGKNLKYLILVVLVLLAGVLAYSVVNRDQFNNIFTPPGEEGQNIINPDTNEINEDVIKNIKNITIEDIREASESTGINPLDSHSLSDTEIQAEIYKEIGNSDPQNNIISVSDVGIGIPYHEIRQGDLVTWINDSTENMIIVGDGWGSKSPRVEGQGYTYTFLFKGEYKYKANDKFEGTIMVVDQLPVEPAEEDL